jgi:hypothetical protein
MSEECLYGLRSDCNYHCPAWVDNEKAMSNAYFNNLPYAPVSSCAYANQGIKPSDMRK